METLTFSTHVLSRNFRMPHRFGFTAFSSHQMSGNDHSSRVAAAMAESSSRKRESKGSASTNPRSKFPRGNLPNTKSFPDTGRSNVVTEDIGKLFVKTKKTC
ncbi:hypothetical protein MKW92_038406 [Papaver armeniacum]|nr:hypothetical protein MKW92_038406 [Papaver armeniacum]